MPQIALEKAFYRFCYLSSLNVACSPCLQFSWFCFSCYFCDICLGVFNYQEKSLLLLRYLRTFRGPSWFLLFLSLEFCYICYFYDCCDICHRCFQHARKILVTFAIFAIFADISGPFLASSFSKSWFLLDLLFLRFLRYLSRVFSASKKNPCYFCDFCDICGHFGALLGFFFF